ncbi:hypothetical protein ACFFYR_02400, partial [Paraburkholderia dipogonis]|uniref:hypothetical protein n=1 Tax=Paraburkholderia dipogonis TaxID=1211383 RepID=UPI0035E7432C
TQPARECRRPAPIGRACLRDVVDKPSALKETLEGEAEHRRKNTLGLDEVSPAAKCARPITLLPIAG